MDLYRCSISIFTFVFDVRVQLLHSSRASEQKKTSKGDRRLSNNKIMQFDRSDEQTGRR